MKKRIGFSHAEIGMTPIIAALIFSLSYGTTYLIEYAKSAKPPFIARPTEIYPKPYRGLPSEQVYYLHIELPRILPMVGGV